MDLLEAARGGHAEECRRLLAAGADVDARNEEEDIPMTRTSGVVGQVCWEDTALHIAAQNGHVEICCMLMKAGAAIEARNRSQETPLHTAARRGRIEVCRLLIQAGAVINTKNRCHFTPLHAAAGSGNDPLCLLLTSKGADLTACNSYGYTTPADNAQARGHAALATHMRNSNGAHCLRCTGPSLEPRLLWNDTTQQQEDAMLDEMQAQWLARVAEGCAHARIGLMLLGVFKGGLSTHMLVHVMGYVFGGTQAHLKSCISTGRVTAAMRMGLLKQQTATAEDEEVVAKSAAAPLTAGGNSTSRVGLMLCILSTRMLLSMRILLQVTGSVLGGAQAHLRSCISTGRATVAAAVAAAMGQARQKPALTVTSAVKAALVTSSTKASTGGASNGGQMQGLAQQDPEQLPPKLALMSHALALAVTVTVTPVHPHPASASASSTAVLSVEARQQLQAVLTQVIAAAAAADEGCEWLHAYCTFLQRRYRLGSAVCICVVCSEPSKTKCSQCKGVYYCGRNCQKPEEPLDCAQESLLSRAFF
jgi:hypothetical protein